MKVPPSPQPPPKPAAKPGGRPKGETKRSVKGAAGGMKGADYVDNDAPLAGGDPMDPIDGETGSFAVDADGPEGRRRRGDPNDADIDLAQQQLQREE